MATEAHERVLPPSANWYYSQICAWGFEAQRLLLAFGAKNSVFLYQFTDATDKYSTTFVAQLPRGQKDQRVTCVQLLQDELGQMRVLCAGEEGSVQIWDFASQKLVEQHRKHSADVLALAASDPHLIVAGDRQGQLSIWLRDSGQVALFRPLANDGVCSMDMAPGSRSIVAVGFRSGALCIIDMLQQTICHRLDGHDQEVQCVVWKQPRSGEDSERLWLASSSRDRTIKVWRTSPASVPELEQVLTLPKNNQATSYQQSKRLWLPVAWSYADEVNADQDDEQTKRNQHRLWSGSYDGALLLWEWNKKDLEAQTKQRSIAVKPQAVKNGHNRLIFNIMALPSRARVALQSSLMLTVSLDRELRIWKDASTTAKAKPASIQAPAAVCVETIMGLGGHVYSVAYNASNKQLAAAVGDQTIRLWNMAPSSSGQYNVELLWKGLQSKITSVEWHPLEQSILAYGTEDGRVGIYDVQSKKHTRLRSNHTALVSQLQWRIYRPRQESATVDENDAFAGALRALEDAQAQGVDLEQALAVQKSVHSGVDEIKVLLWSQHADGHVFEFDVGAADSNPVSVNNECSSVAVYEHGPYFAVGKANGSVDIMNWELQNKEDMTVRRLHDRIEKVVSLSWNKNFAALLASGDQSGTIVVYDLADTIKSTTPSFPHRALVEGYNEAAVGILTGHRGAVTCLRWGPNSNAASTLILLASSSADGSVQVWDVVNQTGISNFRFHAGRVLSVDWLSDCILASAGEDQSIRLWNYSKQSQKMPPVGQQRSKQQKQKMIQQGNTTAVPAVDSADSLQVVNPTNLPPVKLQERSCAEETRVKKSTPVKSKKAKQTLFHAEDRLPTSRVSELCRSFLDDTRSNTSIANDGQLRDNLALLLQQDRAGTQEFIMAEVDSFKREQDWESLAHIYLFQGRILDALHIVAREKALNASWLAYAPMAGMDVWREITNLYAHQLDAEGDTKAAAFHFLSLGKVYAAVQSLAKGGAFKEALALIRSRLSPQDPVLNETLLMYTEYLDKKHQFGELAHACLAIGTRPARYRAIHALAKTEDVVYMDLALDIVKHDQDHEAIGDSDWSLPRSFFIDIIAKALHGGNFTVAGKAALLLPFVQVDSEVASSASVSMPLARCFIGIGDEVEKHAIASYVLVEDYEMIRSECDDAMQLLSFLTDKPITHHYDFWQQSTVTIGIGSGLTFEEKQLHLVGRAKHFWSCVLSICKENGISAQNPSELDAAQDYLMASNCFAYLYERPSGSTGQNKSDSAKLFRRLQICRRLLQFVLDLESGYLVSGLEHMQEALSIAAEGHINEEFELVSLLFPRGLPSMHQIPSMGELTDELADARRLWGSFILSQCSMLLRIATAGDQTQSIQAPTAMVSQMLGFLREELILPVRNASDSLDRVRITTLLAQDVRNAVKPKKIDQDSPENSGKEGILESSIENELDSLLALIAED